MGGLTPSLFPCEGISRYDLNLFVSRKGMALEYPDYETVAQVLEKMDSGASASEAHGMLCGMLLLDAELEVTTWVTELVEELDVRNVLLKERLPILQSVHETTIQSLNDELLGFRLFLPGDYAACESHAEAVKKWVEGFLYGIAVCAFDEKSLSADGLEVLKDYAEITKLDTEALSNDDDSEAQIDEIIEYIRVTVLYLADELVPMTEKVTVH